MEIGAYVNPLGYSWKSRWTPRHKSQSPDSGDKSTYSFTDVTARSQNVPAAGKNKTYSDSLDNLLHDSPHSIKLF